MIGIWNTVSDVTRSSSIYILTNKNGNSVIGLSSWCFSYYFKRKKGKHLPIGSVSRWGVVLLCIPPIIHRKKGECLVVVHGDPPLPESGVIQRM